MATSDDLPIKRGLAIPGDELSVTTSRASGPGGQHVNTTESRVQLRWNVPGSRALSEAQRARLRDALASRLTSDGDLVVACASERSQHRNRELARERLAALVRRALTPRRPRKRTNVPRGEKARRREQKRRRGRVKKLRKPPEDE
jgi:ribosome-associated protein